MLCQLTEEKTIHLKTKFLGSSFENYDSIRLCNELKRHFDEIFDNITIEINVTSRHQFYESAEKSTKFFLSQEQSHEHQGSQNNS